MKLSKIVILSAILAVASAGCSNQCSGHGTCGSEDTCTCFPRWGGSDCAARDCPQGVSWVAQHKDSSNPGPAVGALGGKHDYAKCSSKGTCDSDTGECTCFAGFTGLACSRQVCPVDCSGHGRCISNGEFNDNYKSDEITFDSQTWDKSMSRQCACDRGWEGFACDQRMCPVGSDPLSCAKVTSLDSTQFIVLRNMFEATRSTGDGDGRQLTISLGFEDMFNGHYNTHPIIIKGDHMSDTFATLGVESPGKLCSFRTLSSETLQGADECGPAGVYYTTSQFRVKGSDVDFKYADDASVQLADLDRDRIRHALQALPNFAVPSVNVTQHASDDDTYRYKVEFTNAANSGEQNLMTCTVANPATDNAAVAPRMASSPKTWGITVDGRPTPPTCTVLAEDPCYDRTNAGIVANSNTAGGAATGDATDVELGKYCSNSDSVVDDTPSSGNFLPVRGAGILEITASEKFSSVVALTPVKTSSVCSSRGACDSGSGICNCFAGYAGESCSIQTIFF